MGIFLSFMGIVGSGAVLLGPMKLRQAFLQPGAYSEQKGGTGVENLGIQQTADKDNQGRRKYKKS
jgi:hypothetical protein